MFPLYPRYQPLGQPEPEGTFGFMVELLLKSRLKLHLDAGRFFDEDVNAYMAGLLVSYIDPSYLQWIQQALVRYDMDVHQSVIQCGEDRVKTYWIYKVNADDLLMSLGVFRKTPSSEPPEDEQGEMVRLKRYYHAASDFQKRIYGHSTAVGDIHSKLAGKAERYLTILWNTRRDYLQFVQQLSSDDLHRLQQED